MMKEHYLFRRSSGRGFAAPLPNSKTRTQQQEKDLRESSNADGNVLTVEKFPVKCRKGGSFKRSLICVAALLTGGAAVLLKIVQMFDPFATNRTPVTCMHPAGQNLCLDPELSFSENLYMILHTVNDVLVTPPYDAWTLDDLGAARTHMNRLLSEALMREEQPVSLKFTWRLRAQPLDQNFFSCRSASPCTSVASSASRGEERAASFCGRGASGLFPSTFCTRAAALQEHKFICTTISFYLQQRRRSQKLLYFPFMRCNQCSCFIEALQNDEDPKNACHLIASSCAYTSGSHEKSTANTESIHWVGYQVEEDGERIFTDIYSGHYELLPPSDVDSVHFLPHPQTPQHTAAHQRESNAEQQLPETMQREKKWPDQRQDTHAENQRQQHTAVEDQQRRQQQQHMQQSSFCGTFPCASFVSLSQLTQRLFSSWKRILSGLLSAGRSPKRRLVPPFPCEAAGKEKEARLDSEEANGEEKYMRSSECQARDRRDREENRDENKGGARAKEDINTGETHVKGTEKGGEQMVQREEKYGNWRERACTAGESETKVTPTKVKNKQTRWNIYSPHAGEVSAERFRPPVFEVTVYWSAGNLNRDCSEDEGGERKDEEKEFGKGRDTAEERTAERQGGRRKTTREKEETMNEHVKKTARDECGGKEKESKELEDTLQLIQNLKSTFMFCSARDEVFREGTTRARMHREEKETGRGRDRKNADGGEQREKGHDSRAGERKETSSFLGETSLKGIAARNYKANEELEGRGRDGEEEGYGREEESGRFEERETVSEEQEEKDRNAKKEKWETVEAKGNEEKAQGKRNGRGLTEQRESTEERHREPVEKQRNKREMESSLTKETKGEEDEGNQEVEFAKEGRKKEEMRDSAAVELERKMQQSFLEEGERDFADEVEDAAFEFVSPELQRELERREKLEMRKEKQKRQGRWFVQSRPPVCEKDKQRQIGKEGKMEVHMTCHRSSSRTGAASFKRGSKMNRAKLER